jgi:hypothetical protein
VRSNEALNWRLRELRILVQVFIRRFWQAARWEQYATPYPSGWGLPRQIRILVKMPAGEISESVVWDQCGSDKCLRTLLDIGECYIGNGI